MEKEELTQLLRAAEKAHKQHEKEIGKPDPDWAEWYADYIIQKMEQEES